MMTGMASTASALRVLAFGPLAALVVAEGMSACGGNSVKHVDDGGTGNGGSGGAGNGGSGGTTSGAGGGGSPQCDVVAEYAGVDHVDWDVDPSLPCNAGMTEWCYALEEIQLETCLDGGSAGEAPAGDAAPAPADPCPNVRTLCRTQVGCCEDTATLIAGARPQYTKAPAGIITCCYLAQPGFHGR